MSVFYQYFLAVSLCSLAKFLPVPFCTSIQGVSKIQLYLAIHHSVLRRSDYSRDLAEIKLPRSLANILRISFVNALTSSAFCWKIKSCYFPFLSVMWTLLYKPFVYLLFFTFVELIAFKSKTNAEVIDRLIF